MNNRLQLILKLENLSPARLADMIGIQRSGLSHILSGRNKPSFEFINKLLLKFPDINAEWLITGKGKPLKESDPLLPNEKKNNDSFPCEQNDSLEREKSAKREEGYIRDDLPEGDNTNLFNCSNNTESDFPDQFAVNEEHNLDNDENQLHKNQIFASNQPLIHKNRGVKRVIIFYKDGSFVEFTHDKTERR